jgi:putative sterol carrier protein
MVDINLAKEVKEMYDNKTLSEDPKKLMKVMELIKQVSGELDDIKEELEDIDQFVGQMVVEDKDFKWWVKIGGGIFDYAEGDAEDPSFTMKCNWGTMSGMMSGEIDGTSAYMSGDLKIEGNLQDTMAYGEFLGLVMDNLQKLGQG